MDFRKHLQYIPMWGIRQFCFAIMIFLLNTLFSNLSILIFGAFKVGIRYSVIFPDLNDLLQSYKDIHKPHLYNIKKSPKTRCFRGNLLFFDIRLNYLFENCGARRAALRPYFLRSFIRGSRVKNPAFLRTGL